MLPGEAMIAAADAPRTLSTESLEPPKYYQFDVDLDIDGQTYHFSQNSHCE
jgi:hypothetical protein